MENLIKIKKPWGYEICFANTDKYAGKIIFFKKGHVSSLHYHRFKHETIYLDSGLMKLTLEDENHNLKTRKFQAGDVAVIPPGRKHRVEALQNSRIIEVSTPELDDVVRVDDLYGRINLNGENER
ncbi:MAG: cupin domain-containing protein [Candidatus Bathyarchaeia archaeon]|nr:cupin domain-containing protein [Candidatus Bathyarchaeota archaeon]